MRFRFQQLAAPTVIATLGLTGAAIAQQTVPSGPGGPPTTGEAPARPSDERSTSFSGQVDRVTNGPRGEANGLVLDDGRRITAPRHTIVRDLADLPGRTVRVSGYEKPAKVGHATVVVDGRTITAPRHERPDAPEGERRVERSGKVTSVTRGPRGESNGIVLSDGTRVGIPHREVDAASLVGRQATVTGWLKPAEVKEATVTTGGVTYIRDARPDVGGPLAPSGGPRAGGPPAPPAGGPSHPGAGGPPHR